MSKKDHDEEAAKQRAVDHQKARFEHGLQIVKELKIPNCKILDLGCGNGEFAELAKKEVNADVTCLDYVSSHLKRVNKLGFKTVKCNFDLKSDTERLKKTFKNKFNFIVSFDVIEHIFDTDSLLATIHYLLKKDGLLIISTPNLAFRIHRLYSYFKGNIPVGEGHHVRFFDKRRLQQLLSLNGFELIKDYSFGKSTFFMERIIGEKPFPTNILLRGLELISNLFTPTSCPSCYSSLLILAQKIDVKPIGLDLAFRNAVYNNYTNKEKTASIKRLLTLRKQSFFDEHPGLREFIDSQAERLKINSNQNE